MGVLSSSKMPKKLRFEDLLFEEDQHFFQNFDNLIAISSRLKEQLAGWTLEGKLLHSTDTNALICNLEIYREQIQEISSFAFQYDSLTKTKANGYRTFIGIGSTFAFRLTKLLLQIGSNGRLTNSQAKELALWAEGVLDLIQLNNFLIEIHENSKPGELFPSVPDVKCVEDLARRVAMTDMSKFYGTLAAFYLKGDAEAVVKQVAMAVAMYSDVYTNTYHGMGLRALANLVQITMYTFDIDRVVKSLSAVVRLVQVDFCQSYFNIPESSLISKFIERNEHHVECNLLITLPPVPIRTQDRAGKPVPVPVPNSHLGKQPLNVRLIAPFRTENMLGCQCKAKCGCASASSDLGPSNSIFFHLHGGGFVSQTSKSHTTYLKQWASELEIPILSIDYSLAPEAPFPRALEEVVYAYAWMRENFASLGTTGARVIVGGDSAGGNLSIGLFLRCLELDLPRPDAFFLFYPSLLCEMYPSPSRLISLMDPMVMFPFLMRCINAYADPSYKSSCPRTFEEEVEGCHFYNDPLMSPLLIPSQVCSLFPPTHLFSTDVDPCLDETVAFSDKLIRGGASRVTLDVLGGLPHGFLSLNGLSHECRIAVDLVTFKLKELLPTV